MTVPEGRLTWKLVFLTFSVSFGCYFSLGYTLVVTNAPQSIIVNWIRSVKCSRYIDHFNLTNRDRILNESTSPSPTDHRYFWCHNVSADMEDFLLNDNPHLNRIWAICGSAPAAGAFISIWFANYMLHAFGSRGTLLLNNLLGIIGAVLTGICVSANSYEALNIGRFFLGMNNGINLAVVPLYISELSPVKYRGAMCMFPGLMDVIGMLIATLLGLPQILGTSQNWSILMWLRLVPAALLFLTLPFCAESPQHSLAVKNQPSEAKKALQWIRGTSNVEDEFIALQAEVKNQKIENTISVLRLLRNPFLRKVMWICVVAVLAEQLAGAGAVLQYSTAIFTSAGLGKTESLYGSLGLMALQVVATVVAVLLMDRAGRRPLLIISCVGVTATCFGLLMLSSFTKQGCRSCHWGSLVFVLIFIFVLNLGPVFVPSLLVSEMFTHSTRGAATTIASAFCWGPWLIVAFVFPLLQVAIDQFVFGVFGVMMIFVTVYICLRLVETKGKSVEEIQAVLHRKLDGKANWLNCCGRKVTPSSNDQLDIVSSNNSSPRTSTPSGSSA